MGSVAPLPTIISWRLLTCGVCNFQFCVDMDWADKRQADGRDFWCPNGHKIHYLDNEVVLLKRKLEAAKVRAERAETAKRWAQQEAKAHKNSARAYKGQVTKLKKKVSKGRCPCCNLTFRNVKLHMRKKHPDYLDE